MFRRIFKSTTAKGNTRTPAVLAAQETHFRLKLIPNSRLRCRETSEALTNDRESACKKHFRLTCQQRDQIWSWLTLATILSIRSLSFLSLAICASIARQFQRLSNNCRFRSIRPSQATSGRNSASPSTARLSAPRSPVPSPRERSPPGRPPRRQTSAACPIPVHHVVDRSRILNSHRSRYAVMTNSKGYN